MNGVNGRRSLARRTLFLGLISHNKVKMYFSVCLTQSVPSVNLAHRFPLVSVAFSLKRHLKRRQNIYWLWTSLRTSASIQGGIHLQLGFFLFIWRRVIGDLCTHRDTEPALSENFLGTTTKHTRTLVFQAGVRGSQRTNQWVRFYQKPFGQLKPLLSPLVSVFSLKRLISPCKHVGTISGKSAWKRSQ